LVRCGEGLFLSIVWQVTMLTICSAVLQTEGITVNGAREAESTPNIIEELDALLKNGFSPITIDHLSSLARKVYLRYMIIGAHNAALGYIDRPVEVYGQPGHRMKPQHEEAERCGWNGDRQMANLTLRMRDSLWYYELCHAIIDGDIGRVLEIIKVMFVVVDSTVCLTQFPVATVFILGGWCIQLWQGADHICSLVYPCL